MKNNQPEYTYKRHEFGYGAEAEVCDYLKKQGLELIDNNYSCKMGEIDLIMQDGEYTVFIEVRARNDEDFLTALESITRPKQLKVIKSATFYLQETRQLDKIACRFDVVAVKPGIDGLQFYWVKDAFHAH